jgi:hypothetical protein
MFGVNLRGQDALKQAIGQKIIDKIQERTQQDGRDGLLGNSSSKGYSKQYRNSLDFDAAGKGSKVNLTLTGDMLETMDVVDISGNEVVIGWQSREEQLKAGNHITGDTVPKRDFFGLTRSDISEIKSEFAGEIKDALKERGDSRRRAISALAKTIAGTTESEGD